jgi:hypothetical protein
VGGWVGVVVCVCVGVGVSVCAGGGGAIINDPFSPPKIEAETQASGDSHRAVRATVVLTSTWWLPETATMVVGTRRREEGWLDARCRTRSHHSFCPAQFSGLPAQRSGLPALLLVVCMALRNHDGLPAQRSGLPALLLIVCMALRNHAWWLLETATMVVGTRRREEGWLDARCRTRSHHSFCPAQFSGLPAQRSGLPALLLIVCMALRNHAWRWTRRVLRKRR